MRDVSARIMLAFAFTLTVCVLFSCTDAKDWPYPWTTRCKLSGDIADAKYPCITVDSSNTIHVAWTDSIGRRICCTNSTCWGATIDIPTVISSAPAIAVDSKNTTYIAWSDRSNGINDIFVAVASKYHAATINISHSLEDCWVPCMAIGPDDVVHVLWSTETYHLVYANSTDWAGNRVVIPGATTGGWKSIAVDTKGIAHAVWSEMPWDQICYANSSNWFLTMEIISEAPDYAFVPAIVIDSEDVAHVFWTQSPGWDEIYYSNSTDWSGTRRSIHLQGRFLNAVIDSQDVIHLTWEHDDDVYYASSATFPWSCTNISLTPRRSERPAIAVDLSGAVHMVWEEYWNTNNSEVYYCRVSR